MYSAYIYLAIFTRATLRVSSVLATATWFGGWLHVTRRYCTNTAKPILKLFDFLVAPSL